MTLLRRELVAADTMAFYFSRPDDYEYQPGQSLQMTLIDPPRTDNRGHTRELSIASAPHEDELMLAMRMRDTAFKDTLAEAAPGTTVRISEADGDLLLHRDPGRLAVFVAGGIGITPFLSILRHAAYRALTHPMYLFYSNRRTDLAAFLPELDALRAALPNYRLVLTMTEDDTAWSGETDTIGAELLARHLPDLTGPMYYLAGPPEMTLSVLEMLEDLGVAENAIKSSEFDGY